MKALFLFLLLPAFALAQTEVKGLLSEIRLNDSNEDLNLKKSFESEVMISKSEKMAIESLKKILKKNAGRPDEPDLLYRLAELYMRRSRSGHFFDLDRKFDVRLKQLGLDGQKAQDSLKEAIRIYDQMLARFPAFPELDHVLFNAALAEAQLTHIENAKKHYLALISRFPRSELVSDSLLEVGELLYQQQNFQAALVQFKEIEKFPGSKAYPYGLYKSAWCYYNLKNTEAGIQQLLAVIKENPAEDGSENAAQTQKYNLRKEALGDLTLFVGESLKPNQVFAFFDKICTRAELGDIMLGLSSLYESHSRHKEISVFSEQFIKAYPESAQAAKLYTKLVDSLETLKQRDQVIQKLAAMADFCRSHEKNAGCKEEFKKISLEISKKWWDIWLKNKTNTEFSGLTEKAFENLLSLDSPENPDSNSRYAFAELLFQQGKFAPAAVQYEQISKQPQIDPVLKHDSLYAALVSIEKIKNQSQVEKQKELALRYYTEFKNSEHIEEITYKLGFIAYQEKQYDVSLTYMMPLANSRKSSPLTLQAQDAVLDIYNIRKDYVTLQNLSGKLLGANPPKARADVLRKIAEEAHFTQLQIDSKNLAATEQIEALLKFTDEHPESPLAEQALWQAVSLAYAKGYDVKAAELSLAYVQKFPEDKRKADALKDAVKAFTDSAHFDKAITSLKLLQEDERVCDLRLFAENAAAARSCYLGLFKKTKKTQVLAKLLATYPETGSESNTSEYRELQNQILQLNMEPYATRILIQQANQVLAQGNSTLAFALSLKINGRAVGEDVRAGARLIQARILENEFTSQSVHARPEKLALVIAMKTEKFDKALTAYSSALKMSQAEDTQIRALQGIDRLYAHFVQALGSTRIPELIQMAGPFSEKREANAASLAQLSNLSSVATPITLWADLDPEKSVEPVVHFPESRALTWYLPEDAGTASLNACLQKRDYKTAEKISFALTATAEKRSLGLYYLSLIAEAEKQPEKALWLAEKSSEQNPKSVLPLYQKARLLYSAQPQTALTYFEKAFALKESSPEMRAFAGIKAFSDKDFKTAAREFAFLTPAQNFEFGTDLLQIESELQNGNSPHALKIAAAQNQTRPDLNLQLARAYEFFVFNKEMALSHYVKAAAGVKGNEEEKQWIAKKIDFLKTGSRQLTSQAGG